MKKFFSIIAALMLFVSSATACAVCPVNAPVRLVCFHLSSLSPDVSEAEFEAIAKLTAGVIDDECSCTEIKLNLLHVLTRNWGDISQNMEESKFELLLEFIASCGCCTGEMVEVATPAPVKPSTQTHTHHGGNHANGGKCQGCGQIYQKHTLGLESMNNSQHHTVCSCGWTGNEENHKAGALIEKCGDGIGHYRCTTCNADLYWYLLREMERNSCCSCNDHLCCNGCACGCIGH